MNATHVNIQFIAAGIANAKATVVLEDQYSGFYIATSGSGVSYFQPKLNRWQTFTKVDGLANPDVRSMLKTQSNTIWFGTANGASCFCPTTRMWTSLFDSDGLPNKSVWSLMEDNEQNIWFGTNGGGIAVLAHNSEWSSPSSSDWTIYNTHNGLIGDNINALHQDRLHNIWVGTTVGVSCFEYESKKWIDYLKNTTINSITSDRYSNIWFATNQGLVCYNLPDASWKTFNTDSGLGSDTVQTLSYSEKGGLWVGTRNGISQYLSASSTPAHASLFHTLTQTDGLSDNMVWGLFQDSDNNLWIATWGGGVSVYNTKNAKWNIFTIPSEFADTYTMSVIKSGAKKVWIGTWGAISQYNLENGDWLTLSSADNLPNNNVQCLAQLRENEVWTGANGGLMHYHLNTNTWRFYTKNEGLTSDNVTVLLADEQAQKLYIGTDNGLCCFTEKSGSIQPVYAKQFALKSITAMYMDIDRKLWIGTNSGLFQQQNSSAWVRYGKQQGLTSQHITAIIIDEQDTMWVGTDKGLCQRQQSNMYFNPFEPLTTCVSALAYSDNNLWVADVNGSLYRFHKFTSEFLSIKAFGSDPLTSLALDGQGNLWVASQGGGIFWLTLKGKAAGFLQNFTAGAQHFAAEFAVQQPWIVTGRPEAVAATDVENKIAITIEVAHRPYLCVSQIDEKPFVWAGSDEDGLYIGHLNTQHPVIKPTDKNRINALPSRHVVTISNSLFDVRPDSGTHRDSQHIWVGTSSGLAMVNQRYRRVDKTYSYPDIPSGPISALATNDINQTLVAFNKTNKAQFNDKSAAEKRQNTSVWLVTEHCKELQLHGEHVSIIESTVIACIYPINHHNFWLNNCS